MGRKAEVGVSAIAPNIASIANARSQGTEATSYREPPPNSATMTTKTTIRTKDLRSETASSDSA